MLPDDVKEGIQETSAAGVDEFRQLIGGNPGKSLVAPNLRIPSLPTTNLGAATPYNRYLFLLAYVEVPENERICITGLRQSLDIGTDLGNLNSDAGAVTHYPVKLPVTTDDWCFVDGNVSYHLMRIGPHEVPLNLPAPAATAATSGLGFIFTKGPALLYSTITLANPVFYTSATAYTPPNGGRPYGQAITNDLATWTDQRFPRTNQAANSNDNLNHVVDGDCAVALFASVKQTNPATRTQPKAGSKVPNAPPEEVFVQTYNGTVAVTAPISNYFTVGGAILWKKMGSSRKVG